MVVLFSKIGAKIGAFFSHVPKHNGVDRMMQFSCEISTSRVEIKIIKFTLLEIGNRDIGNRISEEPLASFNIDYCQFTKQNSILKYSILPRH